MKKDNEKEQKGYALIYGNRSLTLQGSQPFKRKRPFMFLRSFLDLSYKSGEISESNYLKICKILDAEEERMTLESEE